METLECEEKGGACAGIVDLAEGFEGGAAVEDPALGEGVCRQAEELVGIG